MERILLTIEYDGTGYAGWQRQENGLAIQQVVEEAIAQAQGETVIFASGRTDAGVHAWAQKAHFDSRASIPADKWRFFLNDRLPADIRVTESRAVDPAFHARYWVKDKTYEYFIHNSRAASAIKRNLSCFVPHILDFDLMETAAQELLGEHDFAAFQSTRSHKENTVRRINWARLEQKEDSFWFTVNGNGFLHNMVRIMAGTLIDIGRNKLSLGAFERAFATLSREELGDTAPASGLYLKHVAFFESEEEKRAEQEKELGDEF